MRTTITNKFRLDRSCQLENNKHKREFYLNNPQHHRQVEISGHRKHGAEWKLVCDEGLVDILTELNNNDYNTLFSCQGSKSGVEDYKTAYILIRYPSSEIRYRRLVNYLIDSFPNRVITVNINELGVLDFKMWHFKEFDRLWNKNDSYAMWSVLYDPRED